MKNYLDLMQEILNIGEKKEDRTGTGTISLFGRQLRFDLSKGFPIVTTKRIHFKSVAHELLWFLSGSTDTKYLRDNGVTIWDEWTDDTGNLGPIYGHQWRTWGSSGIDQISTVIDQIKTNPSSRRLIVSAWNVDDLPDEKDTPQNNVSNGKMALAPCHTLFQFYVINNKLSCQCYLRSQDYFLGTPFNISSYALLTNMIAHQCDLSVGELVWVGGDVHLYKNHISLAKLQLDREPYELPKLNIINKPKSIFEYKYENFQLIDYIHHQSIKADIAV